MSFVQVKGLDVDALFISHIQVNQAQKQRRRTYRAHGRINRMFLNYFMYYMPFLFYCIAWCEAIVFCSLHVQPLPHWVDLVWEGRTSEEGGTFWLHVAKWYKKKQNYILPLIFFVWFCSLRPSWLPANLRSLKLHEVVLPPEWQQ